MVVPVRDRPDALDRCLASLGHPAPGGGGRRRFTTPRCRWPRCAPPTGPTLVTVARATAARAWPATTPSTGSPPSWSPSSTATAPCPAGWLDGLIWLFDDPEHRSRRPPGTSRPTGTADRAPSTGSAGPTRPSTSGRTRARSGRDRAVRYVPDRRPGRPPERPRRGRRIRPRCSGWARTWTWSGASSTPDGGSDTSPSVIVTHARTPAMARPVRPPLPLRHVGRAAGRAPSRPAGPGGAAPEADHRRPGPPRRTTGRDRGGRCRHLGGPARPLGPPSRASRPPQAWRGAPRGPAGPWSDSAGRPPCWPGPGLVALAVSGRRGRRAALALVLVPPVVDWVRRRPDLDIFRWVAASVADDVAYGAGVWIGCLRARSFSCPATHGGLVATNSDAIPLLKSDEGRSKPIIRPCHQQVSVHPDGCHRLRLAPELRFPPACGQHLSIARGNSQRHLGGQIVENSASEPDAASLPGRLTPELTWLIPPISPVQRPDRRRWPQRLTTTLYSLERTPDRHACIRHASPVLGRHCRHRPRAPWDGTDSSFEASFVTPVRQEADDAKASGDSLREMSDVPTTQSWA